MKKSVFTSESVTRGHPRKSLKSTPNNKGGHFR